ncbi:putative Polycomb group protein ASXL3 [Galleria mellonella]|uniref:Polycomb group protein ASXL3 n=1 Tax=Galleria mellonella TaxID=7137 RepID=A0A6J1WPM3_GALME|nr:putative Polycomb group protein ASXL3 [Galleria mellonella]
MIFRFLHTKLTMELDVSPVNVIESNMDCSDNSSDNKYITCNNNEQSYSVIRIPEDEGKSSKHSKKQSKRRKKSSSHSRPLPRIIVKPLPPPPPPENREWTAATSCVESSSSRPSTMREVLASIPGFCMKPRKRSGKKLSTAAQLQQTREGCIDLETPDSILVNTNIRALLNKHTFSLLPPLYQFKLGQLLPSVDRLSPSGRLNSSSLNNEFFARACLEWQDCLSGGEFTPENQQKMKTEAEREKSKIDPWKLKHFEPIWGEKSRKEKSAINLNSERPSLKTTIKLRPTASITSSSTVPKIKKNKSSSNSKRMRSVGAVTRSSAKVDDIVDESVTVSMKPSVPLPDLLPLKIVKNHNQGYVDCQGDFSFSDSSSVQRQDDSVSTTPVDPLLLADGDSERNDVKQELDITVVTIEESSTSKDCEEYKTMDLECNFPETSKRLSDDNEDYISCPKRIKYEDHFELDDVAFVPHSHIEETHRSDSNNCSDTETNYANDNCSNEELHLYPAQDGGDTNSEDSKATATFEYDERSVSSISSLKIETNANNIVVNESITNASITVCEGPQSENEYNSELHGEIKLSSSNVNNKDNNTEPSSENDNVLNEKPPTSDSDHKTQALSCETIEVIQEVECQSSQSLEQLEIKNDNSPEKCVEKERPVDNIIQNYYDEHFKDAESFILETGGLSILTPQGEDVKYTPHPNLMELSSYMSETNVTAVVTMPMTQNSSIPMMEVTNTSIVSYPDDNMQDPAKPKNSAVLWKSDSDWTNNENVMTLHPFSNVNTDSAKYVSDDSKMSMDDVNVNDENCMYKEDRDANFNMESSNSSESCQSMKETSLKQELETVPTLVSSTTATHPPVISTTMTQSIRPTGKKSKSGKESNRSRSSNKVPPGAVNLERSYQICQAVIQNSPNRDALRGQLRPPPALLSRPPRPTRAPQPPPPHPPPPAPPAPPPVLVRQLPVSVMSHNEINENRSNNVGQYILVQRTPNVAPRASSAPPSNQNSNVSVARCRSVGADDACVCNLRAMILCKKCGAFCHDDCIGSAELCLTCLIR